MTDELARGKAGDAAVVSAAKAAPAFARLRSEPWPMTSVSAAKVVSVPLAA